MTTPNWFRHNEAADYCRISPRTLRRWRSAGRIRAYEGKYFRDDLDRAVRNDPVGTPATVTGERVGTADVKPDGSFSFRLPERDVVRTESVPGTLDLLAALQASVDRARAGRSITTHPSQRFGFNEPQQHTGTIYITQVMNQIPLCTCTVDDTTAIITNPECLVHGTGTSAREIAQMDAYADGAAERNGDQEPVFEDPPAAPARPVPDWYEWAAEDATWD